MNEIETRGLKFSANLSMLFNEVPFLERFKLAAQSGFSQVEFLFPFEFGVENIRQSLLENDLQVVLFNLPPGDKERGEWGMLSVPERRQTWRQALDKTMEAAEILGCTRLNVMYGKIAPGSSFQAQRECALENLAWAAPRAGALGVELLIEPLNTFDFPGYGLTTTGTAAQMIEELKLPNIKLLYDIYHAQMMEGNLANSLTTHFHYISHIQIADVPGRHQPGTGEINFPFLFQRLVELGYKGSIGLEYRPQGETMMALDWLPVKVRSSGR